MKILIVDDSVFSRSVLKPNLERMGYTVVEATDGQHGLSQIVEEKPDCVITDILMPVMDGFEMLRNMSEQKNNVPVIVLSADIQESTVEKINKFECVHIFLHKPIKLDQVVKAIKEITIKV